jgi:mono/diheme cytochrome c family protein
MGFSQKKGGFIPIILPKGGRGVVRGQAYRILAINSASSSIKFALYTVVVIGFFGGQLVYSGWSPKAPAAYKAGEKIFKSRCSGCHPHGGEYHRP